MPAHVGLDPARRVLAALARGVLGEGYVPEAPSRMLETLEVAASETDRRKVLNTLRLLDTRAGSLLLTHRPVPVSWMNASEAEAVVQAWQKSRLGDIRLLANTVIGLTGFALYAHEPSE